MNGAEERCLAFIMQWMDEHLDERGARQAPGRNTIIASGHSLYIQQLQAKKYLHWTRDGIYPTAKAEAWWIRRKSGVSSL